MKPTAETGQADICLTFPIKNDLKQGDALSPLLFNFTLEDAIRRVQVNQDGLKLNDTHQDLISADDVNILGGSVHTLQNNKEDFLVSSKKTGLEVNADKTKCVVMSRDKNAEGSHDIKIENNSFERWKNSNVWEKA